jgi:putative MATE family efflux protein
MRRRPGGHPLDRTILGLALPALVTLAAEPLYVATDTAIVGRLGTDELGGLAVAGQILVLVLSCCNFLAYGTTQRLAYHEGAGRHDRAAVVGIQALWLCVLVGVPIAAVLVGAARPLAAALGAEGAVLHFAVEYLRIGALGVPAALVVIAGNGVLRGVVDFRTPLVVMVVSSIANLVIELALVYPVGMGFAGSAWSTVMAQAGAAAAFLVVMRRTLAGAPRRPDAGELVPMLRAGGLLLFRVAALMAAFTTATAVAARIDTATLGAHQVVSSMFFLLALALDALAIPAQTLTARAVGGGDEAGAHEVARRVVALSVWCGAGVALALAALSPVLPRLFSGDGAVTGRATAGLLALAVLLLPGAVAFAFDGIFIGLGEYRFLARVMALTLCAFLPAITVVVLVPSLGVVGIWTALGVWMAARAAALSRRFQGADLGRRHLSPG